MLIYSAGRICEAAAGQYNKHISRKLQDEPFRRNIDWYILKLKLAMQCFKQQKKYSWPEGLYYKAALTIFTTTLPVIKEVIFKAMCC